jgi:ubiquinone/menaquinone biosynthesis C-methylase UbiE
MTEGRTSAALLERLKARVRDEYAGVFAGAQFERHYHDYVTLGPSEDLVSSLRDITGLAAGDRLVDLGCGLGTFVLACLGAGINAVGVDIGERDLSFARERLVLEVPGARPELTYRLADAGSTGLPDGSFTVATAWNILEHVEDPFPVIREAHRLLSKGGYFMGVAPNYAAFRREAHYQLPWLPLMPRWVAGLYLRLLGRKTAFFEENVKYVTNWGILHLLKREGFELVYPKAMKLIRPDLVRSPFKRAVLVALKRLRLEWIVGTLLSADYWNPFRPSVEFCARKAAVETAPSAKPRIVRTAGRHHR